MKKLVWRLKEQPTTEKLRDLVSNEILSKEEAREILFSTETEVDRDKNSLESEVKFLRDLVEKLSKNRTNIIETIRTVEIPYYIQQPWYQPYQIWCGASSGTSVTNFSGNSTTGGTTTAGNFTEIQTF